MYYLDYIIMTPEEKKTFWCCIGIFLLVLAIYGIYYYFKHKKDRN